MYTIVHDGNNIIKGFGRRSIDAKATNSIVKVKIQKTDTYKKHEELFYTIQSLNEEMNAAETRGKKEMLKVKRDELLVDFGKLQNELIALDRKMFKDHAVYFEPTRNEKAATDEEVARLKAKLDSLEKDEKILVDGTVIKDKRGKYVQKKNGKFVEFELNEIGKEPPASAKKFDDLDESERQEYRDQKESERIENMSKDEKQKEFEIIKKGLIQNCIQEEASLRIQGIEDYEKKAKSKYDKELKELEGKYL